MQAPTDTARAAATYAGQSWHVLPLVARGKTPTTTHGVHDASADRAQITRWFAAGADANVGIACGPSGLLVLDIDPRNGGDDTLAALITELGPLPETITADTGGGGTHLVFRTLHGEHRGKLGPGIDLLGPGRYIVAPPSVHPSGGVYRWRAACAPGEIEIAELPTTWAERCRRPATGARPPVAGFTPNGEDFYAALAALDQGYVLESVSGSWLVGGEVITLHPSTRGRRNISIDGKGTSNFVDEHGRIGASATGRKDGGPTVAVWCRYYGHDDKAIRRGLIEMVPELTRFARPTNGHRVSHRHEEASCTDDNVHERKVPTLAEAVDEPRLTELGNAQRFATAHGNRLRYVRAWDRWLVWDGKRWRRDEVSTEIVAGKEVVGALYQRVSELASRAAAGDEAAGTEAALMTAWARSSARRSSIAAMVSLAQSEDPIAATANMFDRDGYVLNVLNGTIDLRTGKLRAHNQTDMLTMLAPTDYNPAATAPTWDRFLRQVQPDQDVRTWLQRYAGYALTGDVTEQLLAFMFGGGANGKSVYLDTLLGVLGDYGLRAAPDLLLAKYGEVHPTELADLEGRRLVVASEIEQGRAWAESTIKRITGDRTISARRMRENFHDFAATHKLFIAANTKPVVRGTDHAIWRRMRLVPWTVTIPEAERDKGLTDRLLAEGPGILAWAVRGCLEWSRAGLGDAAAVAAATAEYRADQDVLGNWIDERCTLAGANWTATTTLYADYTSWCEETGLEPWTRATWRARLIERDGIEEHRQPGTGQRGLLGLGLRGSRHLGSVP